MRTTLLIVTAVGCLLMVGCKKGPGTSNGITACEQLEVCACHGPDAGFFTSLQLQAICAQVETLAEQDDGQETCADLLDNYSSTCGSPLQFNFHERNGVDNFNPGAE